MPLKQYLLLTASPGVIAHCELARFMKMARADLARRLAEKQAK